MSVCSAGPGLSGRRIWHRQIAGTVPRLNAPVLTAANCIPLKRLKRSGNKRDGGPMPTDREIEIATAVGQVYNWLDSQISHKQTECEACGKCCDFDGFGHRLFVTSCELIYFGAKISPDKIRPMSAGRCPYNIDGRCTVYPHRFAGCRIFSCKADKDFQGQLSEEALERFKIICDQFDLPYHYTDLPAALNNKRTLYFH